MCAPMHIDYVFNFLYISENVVAKQCTRVTLDACEENMVEPLKDRKFRYCEGVRGSATHHFHSCFAFYTVMESLIPTLKG